MLGCITLKYTPSNSIVFVYDGKVTGVGAGQQNRVDCIKIAGSKSKQWANKYNYNNSFTMCSDAFLPFEDNIETAYLYDVDLIIQPGGSINDKKVKKKSDERNIDMVYTNQRLFYH